MADVVSILCRYDFLACDRCGRLCTKLEAVAGLGIGGSGHICPCGALRYRPANLPWYKWALPRVWVFALMRLRGRV